MAITDPFVLPPDVILTPVTALPPQVQQMATFDQGDYAISRRWSRSPSRIIDGASVALLERFRQPATIVEAVIDYSQATNASPEQTLSDAYPLLQRLIASRLLVPPGSPGATQIAPSTAVGDQIGELVVLRCVRAVEDTEIYQARTPDGSEAAVKLLRAGTDQYGQLQLEREAAILRHLDGAVGPRLVTVGVHAGRPFLASAWCHGRPVSAVAEEYRAGEDEHIPTRLLSLCRSVVEAYAVLHARGVVHADVHPDNVLIQPDGRVTIIDYGLSRWGGATARLGEPHRGGVGFFFEPEYARTARSGQPAPASYAGEQYALGALCYLLLTGAHYVDFGIEQDEVFRQIVEEQPLPFSRRDTPAWPELEAVLARALQKDPAARFPAVAAFARALGEIAAPDAAGVSGERGNVDLGAAEPLVAEMLERVRIGGELLAYGVPSAPTCSLMHGAAGIAYTLYRIATVRADSALLALADVWATKAAHLIGTATAFANPALQVTPETVGETSPFHTASGVACVQALIAGAMGDEAAQHAALQAFIAASTGTDIGLDITLGRSSTLLAAALLLESVTRLELPGRARLLELGNQTLRDIWDQVANLPPVGRAAELSYLGMAHGWAGILYATLCWSSASGQSVPAALPDRLQQLADAAEPAGPGSRWNWASPLPAGEPAAFLPGWCHGSAGYVHLWTLADTVLGGSAYAPLAEGAAVHAWSTPDRKANLCCGMAGRSYGLLRLYKHTRDRIWLERATDLAKQAAQTIRTSRLEGDRLHRDSLYKGDLGVALLIADLAQPETGCMPFFELEG